MIRIIQQSGLLLFFFDGVIGKHLPPKKHKLGRDRMILSNQIGADKRFIKASSPQNKNMCLLLSFFKPVKVLVFLSDILSFVIRITRICIIKPKKANYWHFWFIFFFVMFLYRRARQNGIV